MVCGLDYSGSQLINICEFYMLYFADEEGLSESHEFYKNIPTGIFGSKKPRSAEEVKNIVLPCFPKRCSCTHRAVLMKT